VRVLIRVGIVSAVVATIASWRSSDGMNIWDWNVAAFVVVALYLILIPADKFFAQRGGLTLVRAVLLCGLGGWIILFCVVNYLLISMAKDFTIQDMFDAGFLTDCATLALGGGVFGVLAGVLYWLTGLPWRGAETQNFEH